ncbi:MAG: M48 family metallopeptidase [Acidimicrobiia bacterium]|nr:M48 family metallopeptidase [Acidimicrobiia bacterium]
MYEQIAANKRRAVLCVIAFFFLWVGIGALVGVIAAAVSKQPDSTPNYGGAIAFGAVVAAILALLGVAYSISSGARLVLAVSGAREADPNQYRQLHNLVEELAIGDGLPKPAVYVIDDPSPNAFATGTSPNKAAITATTGLLEIMNREELEGVLGHEMSHIKNYDVRLLLIVTTLIGLAGLLASIVWRNAIFFRPRGRDSGQIMIVVFVAGILLAMVAVVFGPLIKLALSRRREELADVSSVGLTRNPEGLISALKKLQQNDKPFKKFNHATAAMCIDDPLQHHEGWFHRLFDTHPPIDQRIAILEHLAFTKEAPGATS